MPNEPEFNEERLACFRCGQGPEADVHQKSYGSGSYTYGKDGSVVATQEEPHHAPWQHPFEHALIVKMVPYNREQFRNRFGVEIGDYERPWI